MSRETAGFFARGGTWVLIQSMLMLLNIVLGVTMHGDWSRWPLILTGASTFLVGGYFGLAGVQVLGRNRTPFPQPRAGSQLMQKGIYAWVRHPLYTGVTLASIGWALIWQSPASLLAALALIPFFYAKARREERWLCEQFPDYPAYAARVPRFIPRIRALD